MSAIFTPVPSYLELAIADGFVYECSCGELFREVAAAGSCRKCRNYCVFGHCTHVVDVRDGSVVDGAEPSEEAYMEAAARAEAKWAEEKAQLEFNTQMWLKEGELYEAELARQAEQAVVVAEKSRLDRLWAIQDYLMGVK